MYTAAIEGLGIRPITASTRPCSSTSTAPPPRGRRGFNKYTPKGGALARFPGEEKEQRPRQMRRHASDSAGWRRRWREAAEAVRADTCRAGGLSPRSRRDTLRSCGRIGSEAPVQEKMR